MLLAKKRCGVAQAAPALSFWVPAKNLSSRLSKSLRVHWGCAALARRMLRSASRRQGA